MNMPFTITQYLKSISDIQNPNTFNLPTLVDNIGIHLLDKSNNFEQFRKISYLFDKKLVGVPSQELRDLSRETFTVYSTICYGRTIEIPLRNWLIHYFYAKGLLYGMPRVNEFYVCHAVKITKLDILAFQFIYNELTFNTRANLQKGLTLNGDVLPILRDFSTGYSSDFRTLVDTIFTKSNLSKGYLYAELY